VGSIRTPGGSTGALLRADPEGSFEVARVLPGRPAAGTTLRSGDRVVEIDGTPLAERGCRKLNEPEKPRQRLGVQRGERIEQFDIELIDLIE